MKLGEKIRKIREIKNLKQRDMAQRLGITPQAYSKIERDETRLTNERLSLIAAILGVHVDYIWDLYVSEERVEAASNVYKANQSIYEHIQFLETIIEIQKQEITRLRIELEKIITAYQ